jgi:hypothetical protein
VQKWVDNEQEAMKSPGSELEGVFYQLTQRSTLAVDTCMHASRGLKIEVRRPKPKVKSTGLTTALEMLKSHRFKSLLMEAIHLQEISISEAEVDVTYDA